MSSSVPLRRRVLLLCTGNSARSQMAEGLINHFLGDRWEAFSAGTHPAGYVHPLAVQAMAELGIDISGQRSKSVEEFQDQPFDVVITLCDSAAQECPVWLGPGRAIHMGFPDPAQADGIVEDRLEAFRRVRDGIREKVLGYLERMEEEKPSSPPGFWL
ncbi:MAG: arsenate reductase ArsC [Thermoflexia bacterium]|nr:MAG: arsenate reductase ArsC [Thermoflexia bacterium]